VTARARNSASLKVPGACHVAQAATPSKRLAAYSAFPSRRSSPCRTRRLASGNEGNGLIDRRARSLLRSVFRTARDFPREELDRSQRGRLAVVHEDAAKAGGVVGGGRKVAARCALGGGSDSLHVPDLCKVLRIGHVLCQGAACLVDVGIDLVGRERRRVNGQATADVTADLPHPT